MKTVSHLGPLAGALALTLLGATRSTANLALDFATRNALAPRGPAAWEAPGHFAPPVGDAATPLNRLPAVTTPHPPAPARPASPPASPTTGTLHGFTAFVAQGSITEPATYAALLATATLLLALVRRLGRI